LSILLVVGSSTVTIAITHGSPTPETTVLLLIFTNGTFARCIYKGFVIANGSRCIKVGGCGHEPQVEGVEDADCYRGTALTLFAFSSVLIVR